MTTPIFHHVGETFFQTEKVFYDLYLNVILDP